MSWKNKRIIIKEFHRDCRNALNFIRENFTQNITGTYVTWFNGQKVLWIQI